MESRSAAATDASTVPRGQVTVAGDEFGDSEPVGRRHRDRDQVAGGKITEEPDLGFDADAGTEQVRDLGDHEHRDEQWPGVDLEQFEAGGAVPIVPVDVGVERSGVDDQSDERDLAARSSSILSEMSA